MRSRPLTVHLRPCPQSGLSVSVQGWPEGKGQRQRSGSRVLPAERLPVQRQGAGAGGGVSPACAQRPFPPVPYPAPSSSCPASQGVVHPCGRHGSGSAQKFPPASAGSTGEWGGRERLSSRVVPLGGPSFPGPHLPQGGSGRARAQRPGGGSGRWSRGPAGRDVEGPVWVRQVGGWGQPLKCVAPAGRRRGRGPASGGSAPGRAASIYITECITRKQSGPGDAGGGAFPQSRRAPRAGEALPSADPQGSCRGWQPCGCAGPCAPGRVGVWSCPPSLPRPWPPNSGSDCALGAWASHQVLELALPPRPGACLPACQPEAHPTPLFCRADTGVQQNKTWPDRRCWRRGRGWGAAGTGGGGGERRRPRPSRWWCRRLWCLGP